MSQVSPKSDAPGEEGRVTRQDSQNGPDNGGVSDGANHPDAGKRRPGWSDVPTSQLPPKSGAPDMPTATPGWASFPPPSPDAQTTVPIPPAGSYPPSGPQPAQPIPAQPASPPSP